MFNEIEIWFESNILYFLNKYGNTDIRLAFVSTLIVFLTGGDALVSIRTKYINFTNSPSWLHIEKQSHNILTTKSPFEPIHHVSKMTFRLTAPMIGKLCFDCNQHTLMYFLVGLEYFAGFVFFLYTIKFLRQYLPEDRSVKWLILGLSFTFLGKIFFWDVSAYFDGFALVFMMAAMMSRPLSFQFLFSLLAFWTDERAILAAPLLWIWHSLDDQKNKNIKKNEAVTSNLLAINNSHKILLLVLATTILLRWILVEYYDFQKNINLTQMFHEAIQIHVKVGRLIKLIPFVLFSSFESYWLVIFLALVILYKNKQKLFWITLIIASSISIGTSLLVADVTRSIMYSFPLLIISIRIVASYATPLEMRKISFYIMLFAMIYPTYYMTDYIWPFFIKALITRN